MYGMIEINGKKYIERQQTFQATVSVTSAGQQILNQSLVLPGVADFLLKARVRTVVNAAGTQAYNLFQYREGNTDGGVWYMAAGTGSTNDKVLDPLVFGTGAFPFPIVPPVFYSKTASIMYDIIDVSLTVPYTIYIGWIGSYLIPTQG